MNRLLWWNPELLHLVVYFYLVDSFWTDHHRTGTWHQQPALGTSKYFTGLMEGKSYRNLPYFKGKFIVSGRFSLKLIHREILLKPKDSTKLDSVQSLNRDPGLGKFHSFNDRHQTISWISNSHPFPLTLTITTLQTHLGSLLWGMQYDRGVAFRSS